MPGIGWTDVAQSRTRSMLATLHKASCALVGSSPSLVGRGRGSEIDSHDFVIRVNRITVGPDFGVRTHISFGKYYMWSGDASFTIWLPERCGCGTNLYRTISNETSCAVDERCMSAQCALGIPGAQHSKALRAESSCPNDLIAFVGRAPGSAANELATNQTVERASKHFSRSALRGARIAVGYQSHENYEEMKRALEGYCAADPLCQRENSTSRAMRNIEDSGGVQPTTGMYAFFTFAAACGRMSAYGFGPDVRGSEPFTNRTYKYYGQESTRLEHALQARMAAAAPHRLRIVDGEVNGLKIEALSWAMPN